eukprot:2714885-Lingulodinium_polyedra.AAC.1
MKQRHLQPRGPFFSYLAVAVLALMSLVAAIIVENVLFTSKAVEEKFLPQRERVKSTEFRS